MQINPHITKEAIFKCYMESKKKKKIRIWEDTIYPSSNNANKDFTFFFLKLTSTQIEIGFTDMSHCSQCFSLSDILEKTAEILYKWDGISIQRGQEAPFDLLKVISIF